VCNRVHDILSTPEPDGEMLRLSSRELLNRLRNQSRVRYRSNAKLPMPSQLTRIMRRDERFTETHCKRGDTSLWGAKQ